MEESLSGKYIMNILIKITIPLFLLTHTANLFADENSIDKVEHPYVQSQEEEVSFSSFYQEDRNRKKDHVTKHQISVGRAFSDNWFGELAIAGKKNPDQSFTTSSYELEAKRQITEQGEYSADYGLLLKYENEHDFNAEDVSASLLIEKQWGKWVGTANLTGIYEWGKNINDEFETALAAQAKYRYKPEFEPAIELYSGQINKGMGPVLTGVKRLAPGKKLFWEFGVIWGLDNESSDQTYRALLEYEF